jgi:hypothetical protein
MTEEWRLCPRSSRQFPWQPDDLDSLRSFATAASIRAKVGHRVAVIPEPGCLVTFPLPAVFCYAALLAPPRRTAAETNRGAGTDSGPRQSNCCYGLKEYCMCSMSCHIPCFSRWSPTQGQKKFIALRALLCNRISCQFSAYPAFGNGLADWRYCCDPPARAPSSTGNGFQPHSSSQTPSAGPPNSLFPCIFLTL